MELTLYRKKYNLKAMRSKYCNNDCLAILLVDTDTSEDFAVLTVNLNYPLAPDQAFVDTNNCSWAEQFIEDNNLGEPVGISAPSGYCMYPLYKFNINDIETVE